MTAKFVISLTPMLLFSSFNQAANSLWICIATSYVLCMSRDFAYEEIVEHVLVCNCQCLVSSLCQHQPTIHIQLITIHTWSSQVTNWATTWRMPSRVNSCRLFTILKPHQDFLISLALTIWLPQAASIWLKVSHNDFQACLSAYNIVCIACSVAVCVPNSLNCHLY